MVCNMEGSVVSMKCRVYGAEQSSERPVCSQIMLLPFSSCPTVTLTVAENRGRAGCTRLKCGAKATSNKVTKARFDKLRCVIRSLLACLARRNTNTMAMLQKADMDLCTCAAAAQLGTSITGHLCSPLQAKRHVSIAAEPIAAIPC